MSVTRPSDVCAHCGATTDLVSRMGWVGGKGYRPVRECRWILPCFDRLDAQVLARIAGKGVAA